MNRRPTPRSIATRLLVIELERTTAGARAVISVPGRDGTVERVWVKGGPELLDGATCQDIQAVIAQAVWDFLVTMEGLQEPLPL